MLSRGVERALTWVLLVAGLLLAGAATRDAWHQVGGISAGVGIMRNLVVGPGGFARAHLRAFDVVDVPMRAITVGDFKRFLLENLAHSLVLLGLGVLVVRLEPGSLDSRVFLVLPGRSPTSRRAWPRPGTPMR